MLFDQEQPRRTSVGEEVNLLLPPGLHVSLLRSLFGNLRDLISPQRLPPLNLSSRPVNVGMLVGDILDVPWYRTILSGIGDVLSPDTLPPLHLESQPVEVELISDQPAWWRSLLRNLADAVAPERQPALHLTSSPITPEMASSVLTAPRWSALIATRPIDTSKLLRPHLSKTPTSGGRPVAMRAPVRTTLVQLPPLDVPDDDAFNEFESRLVLRLQRSIRRSRIRQIAWISVAVAEIALFVIFRVIQH